jgi:hypothetical protein
MKTKLQKLASKILRWLSVRKYDKCWQSSRHIRWNRLICWLTGHDWLYIRKTEAIGPTSIEDKRCRMCQCCDGFDELGSDLLEAPFAEPVQLGVFCEEQV